MTGEEFERSMCEFLKDRGYWALKIPRNQSGAQPFDILAIRKGHVLAIDCKVCAGTRFPLLRVEANQWSAFSLISGQSAGNVHVGVMIWHEGQIYFITYHELLIGKLNGTKSFKLDDAHLWEGQYE